MLLMYSLFDWTNTQQLSLLGTPLGTGDMVTRPCLLSGNHVCAVMSKHGKSGVRG